MFHHNLLLFLLAVFLLGCNSSTISKSVSKNELPPLQVVISDLKVSDRTHLGYAYNVKVEITKIDWLRPLFNPYFSYMTDIPAGFVFTDANGKMFPGYLDISGSHSTPGPSTWRTIPDDCFFGRRMTFYSTLAKAKFPVKIKFVLYEEMKMDMPTTEAGFNEIEYRYHSGLANKVNWIESNELLIR